jgi:hypothetical protein
MDGEAKTGGKVHFGLVTVGLGLRTGIDRHILVAVEALACAMCSHVSITWFATRNSTMSPMTRSSSSQQNFG